jgi:hypothetical protein
VPTFQKCKYTLQVYCSAYRTTQRDRIILKKLTVIHSRNYPNFMEHKGILSAGPYPVPNKFPPKSHIVFLNTFYYYYNHTYVSLTLELFSSQRRSHVINTATSYSGGPGFSSQPGDRLSWLSFFVIFLSFSKRMSGWYLKINNRFLPNSFHCHHSRLTISFDDNTVYVVNKTYLSTLKITSYALQCTKWLDSQ